MVKVTLEFDGSVRDFEKCLCGMDDSFNIIDSIIYELDYGEKGVDGEHIDDEVGIPIVIKTEYDCY